MQRKNNIFIAAVILLSIVIISGWWYLQPYRAMEEVQPVLTNGSNVEVDNNKWLVFKPTERKVETGLIFYPGARVEPEAYAPLVREVSKGGYLGVIVPMPLNLAVFGSSRADEVIDSFQGIEQWYIGGHSLGGAMAARYADKNPEQLAGLILLASYPGERNDLTDSGLRVLSVYATEDGYTTPEKIKDSKKLLPPGTEWIRIEGGNHSQFGYYGFQTRDHKAEISREKQQNIIINAVKSFLK